MTSAEAELLQSALEIQSSLATNCGKLHSILCRLRPALREEHADSGLTTLVNEIERAMDEDL